MSEFVEDKIRQSVHDRKNLNSRFSEKCSTYDSFLELEKRAFSDGSLQRKHKELMALAISIVTKCEPVLNGMFNRQILPEHPMKNIRNH